MRKALRPRYGLFFGFVVLLFVMIGVLAGCNTATTKEEEMVGEERVKVEEVDEQLGYLFPSLGGRDLAKIVVLPNGVHEFDLSDLDEGGAHRYRLNLQQDTNLLVKREHMVEAVIQSIWTRVPRPNGRSILNEAIAIRNDRTSNGRVTSELAERIEESFYREKELEPFAGGFDRGFWATKVGSPEEIGPNVFRQTLQIAAGSSSRDEDGNSQREFNFEMDVIVGLTGYNTEKNPLYVESLKIHSEEMGFTFEY